MANAAASIHLRPYPPFSRPRDARSRRLRAPGTGSSSRSSWAPRRPGIPGSRHPSTRPCLSPGKVRHRRLPMSTNPCRSPPTAVRRTEPNLRLTVRPPVNCQRLSRTSPPTRAPQPPLPGLGAGPSPRLAQAQRPVCASPRLLRHAVQDSGKGAPKRKHRLKWRRPARKTRRAAPWTRAARALRVSAAWRRQPLPPRGDRPMVDRRAP
jgi:hypothetical protein